MAMTQQQKAKAFLLSLLGLAVVAGLTVTLVGVYGKNPFPHNRGGEVVGGEWEDPKLNYVKAPSLDKLRSSFQPDVCFDNYNLEWMSGKDGQVYVNGAPFFVKGMSYDLTLIIIIILTIPLHQYSFLSLLYVQTHTHTHRYFLVRL